MLGGLSGERQTAGVQHLVLPPTDWQANQLTYYPASTLFFPWDLLHEEYMLGFAEQLVYMEALIHDALARHSKSHAEELIADTISLLSTKH